jgi:hypothetical protein
VNVLGSPTEQAPVFAAVGTLLGSDSSASLSTGDQTYESLARKGETMTTAAMVAYAFDQIDQARTDLNPVSE